MEKPCGCTDGECSECAPIALKSGPDTSDDEAHIYLVRDPHGRILGARIHIVTAAGAHLATDLLPVKPARMEE